MTSSSGWNDNPSHLSVKKADSRTIHPKEEYVSAKTADSRTNHPKEEHLSAKTADSRTIHPKEEYVSIKAAGRNLCQPLIVCNATSSKTALHCQFCKPALHCNRLFSTAGCNHRCESVVELLLRGEILESHVHTVAPVVTWVRRHVDTLVMRILAAELAVH